MKVKNNDIITFYGISWNDGWEFDAPSIITSPGYFYSESYAGLDGLIEELCIDLSVSDEIYSEDESIDSESAWRGWKVEQFDKFIKDSFDEKKTEIPDYFKEFKKEIGDVLIMKQTVQFIWNEYEEYFDCVDLEKIEKWIEL